MYRAPSPIFDVPEFPTLRRVKPLPKRRRTSESLPSLPSLPDNINLSNLNINLNNLNLNLSLGTFLEGLQLPGPDATAEELLAHAETLSARMALHSYYLPMSGAGTGEGQLGATTTNTGYGIREHDSDEGGGGGDYIDHLQQPNNTKKRKVPANASLSSRSHHAASSPSPSPSPDHDIHANASSHEVAEVYHPPSSAGGLGALGWGWGRTGTGRKGKEEAKLGKATLAGLRHKEMLKTRKRQLAAVLGALSVGDTLALDQALSTSYPSVALGSGLGSGSANGEGDMGGGGGGREVRVRLSKRRVVRLARAARRVPRHPDQAPFPTAGFTFVCPSATADRLIATKEEVATLRSRFEAELARQASKAAKMAAASRLMAKGGAGAGAGGGGRGKKRIAGSGTGAGKNNGTASMTAGAIEDTATGTGTKPKSGGGKKKKRSALANASNPHHLRNYVPSRLPSAASFPSAAVQQQQQYGGTVSPLALRFLSADIPPRRRKSPSTQSGNGNGNGNTNGGTNGNLTNLTNPADEWICAFCEYALFYGEKDGVGGGYRKAVRGRKKILKRRRRARERAARAARGLAPVGRGAGGGGDEDGEGEGGEGEREEWEDGFESGGVGLGGGGGGGGGGEEGRVGVGVGVGGAMGRGRGEGAG
ncbi:hypothetical protein Hypma_008917 [Hypsizygus marmoreus]|uniref:Uncharacterized protein n=1 Tax=Hypsizygus marmoreus TaxID=39966 RepID=A0A369JVM2_HYPMA|nr:hypothetical protein Hypma_008917 [Hypsizygus marmoreus]